MSRQGPRPADLYRQSAVIPYRQRDGGVEVLLITSRKRKRWVIPKGVVEPGLSPADSAAMEALEEAGAHGEISEQPVGSYRYRKWGGECTVEVYLMHVTALDAEWMEAGLRDRQWLPVEQALARIREPELRAMIASLPDHLG